jgi:hypothetical protein
MWRVSFELADVSPQGEVINRSTIGEGGFDNEGQAEAWLATGAQVRYGPAFWRRVQKVSIVEGTDGGIEQVPVHTVVGPTVWYTKEE